MITIFSVPKSFKGEFGVIQRNAILSWKKLRPECEIILLGDDQGVEEAARELNLSYIPEIKKNKHGTPLVNDIFEKAEKAAKNSILAYLNADIIVTQDFLEALSQVSLEKFLLIGKRWDLDIKEKIDFQKPDWEEKIKEKIKKEGKLHGPAGIDYFIFPKGVWRKIPPFALGRTSWDNWLIYQAQMDNVPLIDATPVINIIHQNHSYLHAKDGKAGVWKGEEAKENLKLAGGKGRLLTIRDADFILTPQGIKRPPFSFYHIFSFSLKKFEKSNLLSKVFLFPFWLSIYLKRKIF